ncbi:MAG: FG-GAP repeat protein [Puniceicoccales bacterium]|jgi:hypothetical protein|nr:FG-GAP repeat protein [Puniceicoccales bacterium]
MKSNKNKVVLNKHHGRALLPTVSMIAAASLANTASAVILTPSDGQAGGGFLGGGGDAFGRTASVSGDFVIVASPYHAFAESGSPNIPGGAVYYYNNLDLDGTEAAKLIASDRKDGDGFGFSIGAHKTDALVGAIRSNGSGAAYYYDAIDDITSPLVTWDGNRYIRAESAKLVASDGYNGDRFGYGTSLSVDGIALVGAMAHSYAGQGSLAVANAGAAYCYFSGSLPNDGSVVSENVKLIASDRSADNYFGSSASMSGKNALVGAFGQDGHNGHPGTGAAYYYDNVIDTNLNNPLVSKDGARFLRTESVKLVASDAITGDRFGHSVSLSGGNALVGVGGAAMGTTTGAAYYYADVGNLTLAQNTGSQYVRTETIKLISFDTPQPSMTFGYAVSLSGNNALVGGVKTGAQPSDFTSYGSVYYYADVNDVGLASQIGNQYVRTETLRLYASKLPEKGHAFGSSVSMDGDRFVIGGGTGNASANQVWAGDIRAFTKLDASTPTSLATGGISFESRVDWIIGEYTSNNHVTLNGPSAGFLSYDGDTAQMGVNYVVIGMYSGSNNNTLRVEGMISGGSIHVGSTGNTGNTLHVTSTGSIRRSPIVRFFEGNKVIMDLAPSFRGHGGLIDAGNIFFAGTLELVADGAFAPAAGKSYNLFNFTTAIGAFSNIVDNTGLGPDMQWDFSHLYADGRISIIAVPEPATWGVLGGAILMGLAAMHRRRHRG